MMTDTKDFKPETLATRIIQMLKAKEQAVEAISKLLRPLDDATAEAALILVLEQIWRNELDMSQRWIFTQALNKFRDLRRKTGFESLELDSYYRALEWMRRTTDFESMRNAGVAELTMMTPEGRKRVLELFEAFITVQHSQFEKPLRKALAYLKEQAQQFSDLESGALGETKAAEDAWLNLLIKRVTSRGGGIPPAPPFLPQLADTLTERLLTYDYNGIPPRLKEQIKMSGMEALSGANLKPETKKKIVDEALESRYLPMMDMYRGNSKLLQMTKALQEGGELSLLALSSIRRAAIANLGYLDGEAFKWSLQIPQPELNPGEAWSDAFLARLDALPDTQRQHWPALVAFARTATTAKPSAKWLGEGQKHVGAVGTDAFRDVLSAALPLLSKPRTFPLREDSHYGGNPNLMLDSFNAQSLKGLLWLAPLAADAALARAVAGVVDAALKKVPGVGPREPKIANAAVYALSRMESDVALSALARLNTTVTYKGTLKEVAKALNVVAERLGTSPEDLLELGVPTLGLQSVGERVETWGDVEARLTVGADGAKLTWSKGGKALKSVPASVKKDFAEELKELKTAQKEAEQAASALAQRLDSLMIQEKSWRGAVWAERYLNHPLAGTVARRLIWLVDGVPALWHDGQLLTLAPGGGGRCEATGGGATRELELRPNSEIKLWHPIGRDVAEVLAWRDYLDALQLRQPFKQAWREVYLLTDAERRTGTYSNRFAGHILKQHQFNQLAALRGWRNKLRLMVDDSYPPAMRDLPQYGLRAEYWIEGIGENYGEDTTESGSFLRVVTDQLRFYPITAPENHAHAGGGGYEMWVGHTQRPVEPLPLEQIPPLVLSEIMRDVDLFVGVASVGNDPTWQDGGPGGRFREYWQSYSFGELTETAKTRAEYLARLIPRLKIRDRLTLDGRFLKVQGDRRTYKIHLGSGNILMTPNDQYLCIIPSGKSDGPALDFDGDRVLSLILSKAFLLADDTHITDPVILAQLGR